jgi:hypothetical protein
MNLDWFARNQFQKKVVSEAGWVLSYAGTAVAWVWFFMICPKSALFCIGSRRNWRTPNEEN